ncbi:MAG: MFS transporter [Trueperaceae bacterium]|nr:MFS transporter [Trueperaceae bacterium]
MTLTTPVSHPSATPAHAHLAVSTVFFVNGAILASWVPHIPTVGLRFSLGEGALGLVLLAVAVGAVTALSLCGRLIARFGSRAVTRVSTVLFCIALPLPLLAPTLTWLLVALAFFGMANGTMDVAMNAQAARLEHLYRRPIMSSFHALFSFGGLVGAVSAALWLSLGTSPITHTAVTAAVLLVVGAAALTRLIPRPAPNAVSVSSGISRSGHDNATDASTESSPEPRRTLALLGVLACIALVSEGAMVDWSALYMRQLGATAGLAATAYAAISLTMMIGRFSGDALRSRFGATGLLRYSALFAAFGLGAALLAPTPTLALLGFAAVGLGLANLVPLLFSAAANLPGIASEDGLAAVATAGYVGFLVGPPVIGLAAEVTSLAAALGLMALALLLLVSFAGVANPRRSG